MRGVLRSLLVDAANYTMISAEWVEPEVVGSRLWTGRLLSIDDPEPGAAARTLVKHAAATELTSNHRTSKMYGLAFAARWIYLGVW